MLDLHRILGATAWARPKPVLAALLGAGLLLSGCGQKGPLFLPAAATTAQPASAASGNTAQTDPNNATTGR